MTHSKGRETGRFNRQKGSLRRNLFENISWRQVESSQQKLREHMGQFAVAMHDRFFDDDSQKLEAVD